ncbi:hypothetical protein [Actinoallomurus acanthiterrae]
MTDPEQVVAHLVDAANAGGRQHHLHPRADVIDLNNQEAGP